MVPLMPLSSDSSSTIQYFLLQPCNFLFLIQCYLIRGNSKEQDKNPREEKRIGRRIIHVKLYSALSNLFLSKKLFTSIFTRHINIINKLGSHLTANKLNILQQYANRYQTRTMSASQTMQAHTHTLNIN